MWWGFSFYSKLGVEVTVSCWSRGGWIFKLSFWMVECMLSLFPLLVFTIHYCTAECQPGGVHDWVCATDHDYGICLEEETFAAANLPCVCSWSSQDCLQNVLNAGYAHATMLGTLHAPWSSFVLFPLTPPPTSRLHSHLSIPHHPNSAPHWSVARCTHTFIHVLINKHGPDASC